MNLKNIVLVIILISAGFIVGYFLNAGSEKNVWVDIKKIYAEFNMKKELETKFKQVESQRKNILDSLEMDLNLLARELNTSKVSNEDVKAFEIKKQNYLYKKEQFIRDNEQTQQTYNEQILTQLNQYVKDYCKIKDYDFVFGADGNGSLMYSKESKEITDEVVLYINEKYQGLN